jgi:hypothetical protein
MLIFESEETIFLRQQFLDVIALAVNVIIIWDFRKWKNNIFKTTVFGCNRTSCKRYLDFRKWRNNIFKTTVIGCNRTSCKRYVNFRKWRNNNNIFWM